MPTVSSPGPNASRCASDGRRARAPQHPPDPRRQRCVLHEVGYFHTPPRRSRRAGLSGAPCSTTSQPARRGAGGDCPLHAKRLKAFRARREGLPPGENRAYAALRAHWEQVRHPPTRFATSAGWPRAPIPNWPTSSLPRKRPSPVNSRRRLRVSSRSGIKPGRSSKSATNWPPARCAHGAQPVRAGAGRASGGLLPLPREAARRPRREGSTMRAPGGTRARHQQLIVPRRLDGEDRTGRGVRRFATVTAEPSAGANALTWTWDRPARTGCVSKATRPWRGGRHRRGSTSVSARLMAWRSKVPAWCLPDELTTNIPRRDHLLQPHEAPVIAAVKRHGAGGGSASCA